MRLAIPQFTTGSIRLVNTGARNRRGPRHPDRLDAREWAPEQAVVPAEQEGMPRDDLVAAIHGPAANDNT